MEPPRPNPPESAAVGHEIRDAAPRPILIFAASLALTLVAVHFAGWGALRWLLKDQAERTRVEFAGHPLAGVMQAGPAGPRLEPEPSRDVLPDVDLAEVQAREKALIGEHNWGWVDPSRKFARIPVQDAMSLAVERGLPTVLPSTQPTTGPFAPPASARHGPGGVP